MDSASPEIGRTVIVDGYRTNYHDIGAGPPVLLLHGSGPGVSAWANWRTTIPALAARHRVIALDMLGFGYTDAARGDRYTADEWLGHITAFLDQLDVGPVSIIGNSFGGAMALRLAAVAPARVDRLILMGSAGLEFTITPGLEAVWGFTPSPDNMRALMEIFAFDKGLISDDLVAMRHQATIRPGVQEAYARMFPAPRQQRVRDIAVDPDRIAALEHRTLIIHGRDDAVIPVACAVRLNSLLRNSDLVVFGRCGHWTQIEHASRFNKLVGEFLE